MKNINAIKTGNVVNISIGGKLHKKNCGNPKEADDLFRLVLKAKADPSDANLRAIKLCLNEATRIAMMAGLEADPDLGEVYLAGFNTPIPDDLVEVIKEYHENAYPLDAIINFWKLLMINPDKRVRTDLFKFIKTHDFVLTDTGYMLVYKAVYYKDKEQKNIFAEFISNQFLHVKKDWKCSPNKYFVYRDSVGNYNITKIETAEGWNEKEKDIEILGKLGELYDSLFGENIEKENVSVYTDMYTRTMRIVLGKPVKMERKKCNGDPMVECSWGLHVGCTEYVNTYGSRVCNGEGVVLVCLINPANVVAVPTADCTKIRVTEYFPIAVATYEDGKIDIVEQKYFESDYREYEIKELEEQIAKVKSEELPIETAINAQKEERPMSELLKIIQGRICDIV